MSNPLVSVSMSIGLCLFFEATILFSAACLCAAAYKQIAGFRPDVDFVGKSLDRRGEDETKEADTEGDTDSECTKEIASLRLSKGVAHDNSTTVRQGPSRSRQARTSSKFSVRTTSTRPYRSRCAILKIVILYFIVVYSYSC